MAIPTFLWWRDAIWLVLAMSLYANVESSFGAHQAKMPDKKEEES